MRLLYTFFFFFFFAGFYIFLQLDLGYHPPHHTSKEKYHPQVNPRAPRQRSVVLLPRVACLPVPRPPVALLVHHYARTATNGMPTQAVVGASSAIWTHSHHERDFITLLDLFVLVSFAGSPHVCWVGPGSEATHAKTSHT